jgi:hypothetical protein
MSHLMKLAETLRDIAEECSKSEIEQALGLCRGFADRVAGGAKMQPKILSPWGNRLPPNILVFQTKWQHSL